MKYMKLTCKDNVVLNDETQRPYYWIVLVKEGCFKDILRSEAGVVFPPEEADYTEFIQNFDVTAVYDPDTWDYKELTGNELTQIIADNFVDLI